METKEAIRTEKQKYIKASTELLCCRRGTAEWELNRRKVVKCHRAIEKLYEEAKSETQTRGR